MAVDLWTDAVLSSASASHRWCGAPRPTGPTCSLPRLHSVPPVRGGVVGDGGAVYVSTTRGRIPIPPGDGRWCCTPALPAGPRGGGAPSPRWAWYLSGPSRPPTGAAAPRWSGRASGGGCPRAARNPGRQSFVRQLRTLGRGGHPIPQGSTPESSYDVETRRGAGDLHASSGG